MTNPTRNSPNDVTVLDVLLSFIGPTSTHLGLAPWHYIVRGHMQARDPSHAKPYTPVERHMIDSFFVLMYITLFVILVGVHA